MTQPDPYQAQHDVINARIATRSLIAETEPVLKDLLNTLDQVRRALARLGTEEA